MEKCRNPFKNDVCANMDIVVYIRKDTETYPICRSCWAEIADSDYEWSGSQEGVSMPIPEPLELTGVEEDAVEEPDDTDQA